MKFTNLLLCLIFLQFNVYSQNEEKLTDPVLSSTETSDSNNKEEKIPDYSTKDEKEILHAYHKSLRTFKCGFAQKLLGSLKNMSNKDLAERFAAQKERLSLILAHSNNGKKNKRVLKKVRKTLKKLHKKSIKKKRVKKFFTNLCKASESVVTAVPKGLGFAIKLADQLMTVPVNTLYYFLKGFVTGKGAHKIGDDQYFMMESQSINYALSFYILDKAVLNALSLPMWQVFAVTGIGKKIVTDICMDENKFNPKELRYCKHFNNIDKVFDKMAAGTQNAGSKLHFWGKKKRAAKVKEAKENQEFLKEVKELSNENICEYIAATKPARKKGMKDQLFLMFNPAQFGKPEIEEYHLSADKLFSYPNYNISNMRNVILALGPNKKYEEEAMNLELGKVAELQKKIKKQEKILRKLYKAKSLDKCKRRLSAKKINIKEYFKLKEELGKNKTYRKHTENIALNRIIKRSKRSFSLTNRLKLDWEVHQTNDINELVTLLKSPNIANLIIVSHGVENGRIVDSQLNQYHRSIFKNISPSLMSLSFFTCYSDKVKSTYKVDEILAGSDSYHKMRHLFFVKQNYFFDKFGLVPLSSLDSFLKRVDAHIYRSLKGNLLFQFTSDTNLEKKLLAEKSVCSIELPKMNIDSGSLAISLNSHFLGLVDQKNSQNRFEFHCEHIKKNEENVLTFYGGNLKERLRMSESNIDFDLRLDKGLKYELSEEKLFTREEKLSGGKFKFNVISE